MANYVSTDPADPNFGLPVARISTDPSDPNFGLPVNPEQEASPENQDNPLKRGWRKMIQSTGITSALATGDTDEAARRIEEAARYQAANPGTKEGNELMAAYRRGEGITGGLKEVGGEFAKDWREAPGVVSGVRETVNNLGAMVGAGIIEHIPNMVPPMVGMIGGGAAGAATPIPGGAYAGGWAGASIGNTLVEGGGMAQEMLHKAGINPTDTAAVKEYLAKNGDDILTKAGIKGAVIGAVDTATMGIAGKLLMGPAKDATGRALVEMGVDLTDKAAVKAAVKSPELAARVAADPIYKASTTGAQGFARNATAAALEPAGEFTGEYLGQGLATGEYDEKEAFLEAASSIGQSGATFAGQKAYQAMKYPFKADKEQGGQAGSPPPAAGDILGTPEQSGGQNSPQPGGINATQPEPTEAEKALYTPKSLTALDRVAEIDTKLATATPEESSALQAERNQITASWPKSTPGAETSFTTEAGARLNGQYALIEVGDLTTSHDESLRPVATYPAELQPRERERHASEMQIQQIVGRLDPARLGESADVATGAPIVGADGLVESGNARIIALKRVYQANGQKAIDYKQYLKDNADRFGITPESVDAMQKPVLVRVRNTPVNRAEFARQANQATVARMSPSEQARSDAAQIDSLDDLNPTETGDFSSGTSAGFIRRFMAKLPATEQAGLIDSAGQLSQAGYQRIRNAVLAKAYGDSPVLQRMVESLDNNLRNVGQALLRVAPQVAKAREAINEGALHDVDLTPDLMAAVEELSALKDKGTSVAVALAQAGMFGEKLSPEARELLAFLDQNIRSPRRIAEFIQSYLDALHAAGNPAQGSMFGDSAAPAKRDLIAAARRVTNGQAESAAGDTATAQEGRGHSEDARRDQGGTQGNEGARTDQQLIDTLNSLNPQLKTKMTVEWVEPGDPRTRNVNDGDAASFVGGHNGSSIILVKGKANRRTLRHEIRHMIDMLLGGYQLRKWLSEDADLNKRMVAYLRDERKAGRIDKDSRMTNAEETAQSVLDAYYQDKERLRESFPDVVEYLEKMGADKYAGLMQEVGSGETAQQGEWLTFPPDTGTLGIPREEMPQIKGDHRGALIQFLQGRGINHETVEMPASELKPTQAEFSTKKVANWTEKREGVDRSVLASSDGYILDGHHQWVAALAAGETEKVIRFDVPIQELLAAVREFPSVKKSEGAPQKSREAVRREVIEQQWQEALGDLGAIFRDLVPLNRMVPEDTPNLMPTLVKLFEAGFAKVGMGAVDLMKYVKAELKKIPEFKTVWNKIDNYVYRKAAEQALKNHQSAPQGDLFGPVVEKAMQGDLFSQPAQPEKEVGAGGTAMIDGRPYDMKRDNFVSPHINTFLSQEVRDEAEAAVLKYYVDRKKIEIDQEDHDKAASMLEPVIEMAAADKPAYDQKIIDIAKRTGALGQMIAPLKSMERSIEKLVNDEEFDIGGMKDILRSTIVVDSYADVQAVLDEIEREFKLLRAPKNRTGGDAITSRGKTIPASDPAEFGGYSDVMVNIVMPSGVIAEIQINVPEMLGAKEGPDRAAPGHKLYEAYREVPKESALGQEIKRVMQKYYDAVSSAISARNADSGLSHHSDTGPLGPSFGLNDNSLPSSDSLNHLPSGNSTKNPPSDRSPNRQPSGNLSGTFISSTSNQSIANDGQIAYTEGKEKSTGDANGQHGKDGTASPQGQGALFAPATERGGDAAAVRDGTRGRDDRGNRHADSGDRASAAGVQERQDADRAGRGAEDGGKPGERARVRRYAGIPAGRDIPAKSGRNYVFGDSDLTYAGSWQTKARQNVEAVELLKKLQTENRQANRDEQAVLAKFIGWGASDLANNLFGPQDSSGKTKLDRQLEALENYDEAIQNLGDRPYLTNARYSEYRPAFELLQSKNPALNWYTAGNITKAMLDAAKPDASARKWGELRDRLKAALTPEEFKEASKSTQYAHYTSKSVVSSILSAVEKMGFKGGTILEPGAGIGVFPGLMQTEMGVNSVYTGIEMDSITGGILKQLFPDERILVESFIDSKLPENFYDVAIGNPPFSGQVTVLADPKYAKHAFKLHDYFFAKSLDSVKPGGLVVFVTSRYTMDKKGDKARAFMAERADLVGAVRLPQTAFQKNAGTDVVTDVLFLRKKVPGETFAGAQSWMGLGEVNTPEGKFLVNEYFTAHPEMVLGAHSGKGKMQNTTEPQYTLLARDGDIEAQFAAAVANLPKDVFVAGRGSAAEAARVREMDFNPKAEKEGSFYLSDAGVLMQREGGVGVRAEAKHQKNAEVLKDYISLRDAVKQAQYDQLNDGPWEESLKALQKAYAAFTKKNGRIQQNTPYLQKVKVDELDEEGIPTGNKIEDEEERRRFPLRQKIVTDPEWTLVSALEEVNQDTGEVKESDWLSKRTLGGEAKAEIKTPTDALLATLDDTGEVNIPLIAERMGMEESEVIDSLGTLIYDDPAAGWVMADEYLSGNVKAKLAQAEEAAKSDKRYSRNVDALKDVQPSPKGAGDIKPQIGMNWIPGEIYAQFLKELTGVKATIEYVERTHEWTLVAHSGYDTALATNDWGVGDRANAAWLMEKALTGATISLNKPVSDGKGGSKMVFDPDRTEAANAKRVALRQEFQNWIFQDAARTNKLVALYNDKFNTTVQRKFDGRHLTLPGTSRLFRIFDHVKRGAWRVIQTGNAYLAHAVGSGKTFEMVISAMEQKRLGKVKKPMIIVPGHMLQQFATEWQQLYPTARLAVADEKDFHTDNRRKFVARVAMSDLDGVIMTHSSFKLLDLDPTFKQEMIEQELEFLRASYEEAGGDLDDIGNKKMRKEPKIKRIEAQIERLEQNLAKTMSSEGKDKSVRFDEMGVDFLYVDEAHLFRKLSYATNRQMKGIDPNGSEMAWDLYMKTRWLAKKNPKRYLVMASGTPITNTTAELYTVQRFMAPEALEEKGLQSFDDWAAQFGEEATAIEATSSGKYEPVTRFSKFINVGEMTQMFRDFADVLTEDHLAALLGDARPKVEGGARKSIITPKTDAYVEFQRDVLVPRIEASKAFKPSFEQPNNPDPIININTDARLASIDMRFMEPSLPSDPDSKLNRMIDEIIRIHKETDGNEYRAGKKGDGEIEALKGAAQMVFFESGFGRAVAARRGFNARAWMEKRLRDAGIPPNQLAFMEDYKKSAAKLKLFKDVNTGKVRILVGSSAAMGTGVNAQQRLIALHHLDAPYVPATLEQREGRIIRQGNKNPKVQIYAYSMKGSFDENQWGMLARKKFFIEQAMSGDPNIREIDDVGEVNQLEMAAGLVAENPYVMQHAGAKADVERLMRLSRAHEESRARMQADYDNAGRTIEFNERALPDAEKEAGKVKNLSGDAFAAKAGGKSFDNRKEWGAAILAQYKALADKMTKGSQKIGEMSGFDVQFVGSMAPNGLYEARVKLLDTVLASDPLTDPVGMAMRGVNTLVAIERKPAEMKRIISEAKAKRDSLTTRLDAPFPLAEQLANKVKEVAELEKKMTEYGNEKTGLAREQELEDAWQQRTGAITPMFSRGNGRGMALRDLQAVVDRLSKGFKNLPRVHVLESPAALSTKDPSQKSLRDFIRQSGAWDDVEGATHNGEIYLFASGMADEARAEHVFATHEVTHYGLRGAIGKDMDSALQHIMLFNAKVRKAAESVKQARGLTSNVEAVEEVLADMKPSDLAKLKGWRRVVQAFRDWLSRVGAKSLAKRLDGWMKAGLSDQEKADLFVADLVSAAREWVKSGKGSATTGTHLAEMKLADDWQAQEKWLEREAKARGYKSIDELAEKAYPVFEKLAALWRQKHPADALLSRKIEEEGYEEGSLAWARAMYARREVPDGWYVHGRAGRSDLKTGNVIQMTQDWDVADQYAGAKGSRWIIRPLRDSVVLDFSDQQSEDMDRAVARAIDDFNNGEIDFLSWLDGSKGDDVTEDDVEMAVRESFAPNDIVNSAQAYDNGEWVDWLIDRFGVDFVKTPDGAVAMNGGTGIEAVRADESGSPEEPARSGGGAGSNAILPRSTGFDKTSGTVVADFKNDQPLKAHADYKAAKAGDVGAAARLVQALVKPESIEAAKAFGEDAIYVPVHAEEASGWNKIPDALAMLYSDRAGGQMAAGIFQTNRAYHTGANAMERLLARAEFSGKVESGRRYVLVDDVTTMGSTLADLASYIRSQGGEVAGSVVLVNAARGGMMTPASKTINELEARHGDEIRKLFDIEPGALTASEAQYLLGFRTTDEIRNRVAKARSERSARLLAKGVSERQDSPSGVIRLSRAVPPAPTSTPSPAPQSRLKQWQATAVRAVERMDNAVNGMGDMPDKARYMAERYLTLGRIAHIDEIAKNIGNAFRKASAADAKAIYDYLTTRGAKTDSIQDANARDWAAKAKTYIGTVGDELVKRGLIPQASREEYRDRYLPRLYLAHLLDDSSWRAIGGGKKASDMGYLKERNDDLPEEYRKVILGEITDPAFLAASAIAQPMRDMAILDWLGKIVGNDNWVWPKQLIEWGGRQVSAHWLQAEADALLKRAALYPDDVDRKKAEAVATEMRKKALAAMADMPREHADYKRIPDTPRYGLLRGLMVRREIHDDLVGLGTGVPGDAGFAEQLLGQGGIGSKATQVWKTAKVALNPPGQIRNFVSNVVMLQLSGVPLRKIPSLIVRAVKQINHGGKHWQAAKKYGVTAATFTSQELYRSKRDLLELEAQMKGRHPLISIKMAAAWVMDKAGDAYQFSEALIKTAKMIDAMEREGMTEEQAALEAQKWLFDYSLVNRNIRYLRNAPVGMPFLTYSAKVAPRLVEVATQHPQRFLPWVALFYGMGMAAMVALGGDGDDWDELKKTLPEWLRKKPHAVPLPWRDSEGRIQFTDIGYFFPWSQWAELGKDLAHGEPMDALRSAGIVGGPVPDIITSIKTGIDPFTKKPIADPADPTWQQSVAMMNYVWNMAAPPFMTSNGFLSPMGVFDKQYGGKLVQGITGTTDKFGDPRSTTAQAITGLAGVNIKGVDPDHTRASELQRLHREALDVKAKLMKRLADRSLSEAQRTILISDYTKEMQARIKKAQEFGSAANVPAFARPIGGADAR